MLVIGAGQISMAITRRIGFGKRIILDDKSMKNCETVAKIRNDAGFDMVPFTMDLFSRKSILAMVATAQKYGEIRPYVIHKESGATLYNELLLILTSP